MMYFILIKLIVIENDGYDESKINTESQLLEAVIKNSNIAGN